MSNEDIIKAIAIRDKTVMQKSVLSFLVRRWECLALVKALIQ